MLWETLNTSTEGSRRFMGPTKALDELGGVREGPRRHGCIPKVSLTTREGRRERWESQTQPASPKESGADVEDAEGGRNQRPTCL